MWCYFQRPRYQFVDSVTAKPSFCAIRMEALLSESHSQQGFLPRLKASSMKRAAVAVPMPLFWYAAVVSIPMPHCNGPTYSDGFGITQPIG
jgi:hypothetical protein